MRLERVIPSIVLAVVLVGVAFAGCGGGDASGSEAEDGQSYGEVLAGLRKAALSNRVYDPIQRAKHLEPGERAVVGALCDTAWQLVVNQEAALLSEKGFIFFRIRGRAEVLAGRTADGTKAVRAAMPELQRVVHLSSYDVETNTRYKKACNL